MDALQGLEEKVRAPLVRFHLEDASYQEIATALQIPIGTVMSRLSRGKLELRRRLAVSLDPAPNDPLVPASSNPRPDV